MSLHFIFGRAGTGKSRRICTDIRDYVSAEPGREAYLIVPDQNTYTAESMLASLFPGRGFTSVTVSGFSRFAYHIFNEMHAPVQEGLSPLGQQLIIQRLLKDHEDELLMMSRAARQPHFASELARLFQQMELYSVTADDLQKAAVSETDTPLGRKVHDLSLLYKAYQDYLKLHFHYEGSIFDVLVSLLPKAPSVRNSKVWIDGFNGLPPQKIHIVNALIHSAKDVTVSIPMGRPQEAVNNTNFARPYKMYAQLLQNAGKADSIVLDHSLRFHSPRMQALADHFFETNTPACPENITESDAISQGIHSITASSRKEEADAIARLIKTLVRSGHCRYRDIWIFLRTPEQYADLLERAFQTYEIPAFIDETHLMNNHPLVLLLSHVLQFLTKESQKKGSGWTKGILFPILKTSLLSSLCAGDVDWLENYVLQYGIRSWHKEWHYRKHYDLDDEEAPLSEEEKAEQDKANTLRKRILSLLDPLTDHWKTAQTIQEKCRILYDWLIQEKTPSILSARDEEEFAKSKTTPHQQVWKKIMGFLDEIVHISGDDAMTSEALNSVFQDGLAALSYSFIPPTLDHVTVTAVKRGYAMEGKIVIVPGVLEGEFPKRIQEEGFFTELERETLAQEANLVFSQNLMDEIHQEEFNTYLTLTRASDALYLFHPAVKDDGGDAEPSFLLKQMDRLGYISESHGAALPDTDFPDHSFFDNPDQALSLLPRILRRNIPAANSSWSALKNWAENSKKYRSLYEQKIGGLSYQNQADPLPKKVAQDLFLPQKRFYASVTRLENYRRCPYQYFLRYGLGLEERPDGTMQASDFGSYLHAGLHQFGQILKNEDKSWRDVTDAEIASLSSSIASVLAPRVQYGALDATAAARFTKRSLNQSFTRTLKRLRKWNEQSSFNPKAFEQEFLVHIEAGLHDSLTLTGKIDRIDTYKDGIAIFDYKTGSTHATLSEITSGLKLQLLTYLLAIIKNHPDDHLIPVALMYIYLHNDVVNYQSVPENGEPDPMDNTLASGFLLNDTEKVQELDHSIADPSADHPPFLNVKLNKNGTLGKKTYLLTEEEMKSLLAIVEKEIIRLYGEIKEGKIPIRPSYYNHSAPCQYCPYRSICRFDPSIAGEGYEFIEKKSESKVKEELENPAKKEEP